MSDVRCAATDARQSAIVASALWHAVMIVSFMMRNDTLAGPGVQVRCVGSARRVVIETARAYPAFILLLPSRSHATLCRR